MFENTKLTEHFTTKEFYNTLHEELFQANKGAFTNDPILLSRACQIAFILEYWRKSINVPIRITSGFRCQALNAAVGGAKHSDHMQMLAVDLWCADLKGLETVIRNHPIFKYHVRYVEPHDNYIHVSFYNFTISNAGFYLN